MSSFGFGRFEAASKARGCAGGARTKRIDTNQQVTAVVAIYSGLQRLRAADDATLRFESIAGETGLFPLIDHLLAQIARDSAAIEAIEGRVDALTTRKARFAKRAQNARDILEQAFIAAELPQLDRPLAALQLCPEPSWLVVDEAAAIPARYWRPGKPVLDTRRLSQDLAARRAALEAVLIAPAARRGWAVAFFQRRFLGDAEARALRTRLVGLDACDSPGARAVALAALRRDFVSFRGVRLAGEVPTLAIHLRRPPDLSGGPGDPL
jgi:hypothetical protein